MKVPKFPNNIKVHSYVWTTIKKIALSDDKKAVRLIQRIVELSYDPIPDNKECSSGTVWNLRKKKLSIRRLKCLDILEYRIFYAYKKSGMICVYYIAKRDKETYDTDSFHYKIIKLLYTQWRDCQ